MLQQSLLPATSPSVPGMEYGATWDDGVAQAVDARRSVRVLLAHVPRTGRTALPPALTMDAELAASELVTNAIRHTPGACGMTLRMSQQELTILKVRATLEEAAAD